MKVQNPKLNTCDHEKAEFEFIDELSVKGHEIYRCECGGFLDTQNPKNWQGKPELMTSEELIALTQNIVKVKMGELEVFIQTWKGDK